MKDICYNNTAVHIVSRSTAESIKVITSLQYNAHPECWFVTSKLLNYCTFPIMTISSAVKESNDPAIENAFVGWASNHHMLNIAEMLTAACSLYCVHSHIGNYGEWSKSIQSIQHLLPGCRLSLGHISLPATCKALTKSQRHCWFNVYWF